LDQLAKKNSANAWPGEGFRPQLAAVLWATLAAAGLVVTDRLFRAWPSSPPVWLLGVLALLFPLFDWAESFTNSFLSRHGFIAWRRSLIDSLYWTRSLGVILFAFGLFGTVLYCWSTGWHTNSSTQAFQAIQSLGLQWGAVALCASLGVLLANGFNKSLSPGAGTKILAAVTGPLIVVGALALVLFTAHGLGHVATAALGHSQTEVVASPVSKFVRAAGLLLLLQLAFAYFTRAFVWVGQPMNRANLGGIMPLQWNLTPAGVKRCLDRWSRMLGDHHDESTSRCEMTGIVRQALWRDAFGFIPVYSSVLLFGLWYGARVLEWEKWWQPIGYLWFTIPLIAATADYFENRSHFHYLSLHQKGKTPGSMLVLFGFVMTTVKTIAFVVGFVAVVLVILCASWLIALSPNEYGWRGLICLLFTTVALLSIAFFVVWGRIYKALNREELKKLIADQGEHITDVLR
jgi:hypothetical protein